MFLLPCEKLGEGAVPLKDWWKIRELGTEISMAGDEGERMNDGAQETGILDTIEREKLVGSAIDSCWRNRNEANKVSIY